MPRLHRDEAAVAVVTGGARGIGRAIVERLIADGFIVAIWDLEEADAEFARAAVAEEPWCGGTPMIVDVSQEFEVRAAVNSIVERLGPVEVLVNNAGISPKNDGQRTKPAQTTVREWDQVMSVNLRGAFLVTMAVLPSMRSLGRGRIVNISSQASRTGARIAGLAYAVSKSGLNGLTRTLAADLGPDGITANNIAPGRIVTPMAAGVSDEVNEKMRQSVPLQRLGEAEEIAGVVSFLCSPDGAYLTGTTLDVNGGSYIAP